MTDEYPLPPTTYRYRISLLNGTLFDVTAPNGWREFLTQCRADGYVAAQGGLVIYVPMHAVASIQLVDGVSLGAPAESARVLQ